ncbi:hypothetical protein F5Y15DRAFT_413737 [Xylariaceae sp. FL0016]|nr:hypothetical protein F5Y15DRAFT_413737 [Xylariaceae sp. FL0016]
MLVLLPPERGANLKVKKPEHLFDGALFSILLEILDPDYNSARFQQSLDAQTGRSFHIIHMGLLDYSRRHCPKIDSLIKGVDFQSLDRNPTKSGMIEVNTPSRPGSSASSYSPPRDPASPRLTRAQRILAYICSQILAVFIYGALNRVTDQQKLVALVQGLDGKHQQAIYQVFKEIEDIIEHQGPTATTNDGATKQGTASADADLAYEEALAGLQREATEYKKQAAILNMRLDRLQDSHDELLQKHEELQEERDRLQKQLDSEAGNYDRHRLNQQLRESETLIANLEGERNDMQEERARLLKDKSRLEAAVQKAESLVDENQELKIQNEELSKKANMADNLRKKLESTKQMETELTALRNDRTDLMKTYERLQSANLKVDALKREGEAYASKMQGYEMDIANFRDQKIVLTQQNNQFQLRIAELEQRSQFDEAVVKELQEKVMMLDPSAMPTDSFEARPVSLEDELNESDNGNISMKNLEVQRLQAENAVLKSSIGTETEKGQLIQEMEDLRTSRQALQDRYNEMFEKYTVGQNQLDALIQNMGKDGLVKAIQACYDLAPDTKWLMSEYIRQEAYSNLRTQVLAEQTRSKQLERQIDSFKEQLSDKDRSLLEARGDCKAIFSHFTLQDDDADDEEQVNAVEKSSLDALAELKQTDGMLAVSLRAELDAEREKNRTLKDESEAMQKQLLTAFIEKDELRREAEAANRELQKAADGHIPSTDSIKQSEKMEKLRTRYKQLQQVSHSFPDSSDDDSDDHLVRVDEKHQSFWESWFGQGIGTAESGFYPYQFNEDGSVDVPPRPTSKLGLRGGGGGSLENLSIASGLSSYSYQSQMSAQPIGVPVPERKSQLQKKSSGWFGWLACQYEQAEAKTRELERTLKAVRDGTEAGAQKAQQDQIIKNLQRENAMIATAWYDLSSRLQSNHVVLQRRNDVPRSWLNKQRHMVNATPRR